MHQLWKVANGFVFGVVLLVALFVLIKGQARGLLELLLALPYGSALLAAQKPGVPWRLTVAMTLNGLILLRTIYAMVFVAEKTWAVQIIFALLLALLVSNVWRAVRWWRALHQPAEPTFQAATEEEGT